MIEKIIHLADIHIQNYQRMEEYEELLTLLKESIRKEIGKTPNDNVRIVIAGDLVHQKNTVSNELFSFASKFVRELEGIAKVVIISGNHDLVEHNNTRMDTLTALFDTAGFQNSIFLDKELGYKSGLWNDDNICWCLYSFWDGYRRPDIEACKVDKTPIGLFHGSVLGCSLYNGTTMKDSGISLDIFKGCKGVIAGDIHKRQVIDCGCCDFVYPGSTIQRTYGETVSEHGYVVWNVADMSHKFIDINTSYGMYAFKIQDIEDIDNNKEKCTNE